MTVVDDFAADYFVRESLTPERQADVRLALRELEAHAWELHRFRHTCATEWLRAGAELEIVQQLLGHSTLQQTLCYADLVREDVARGLRKVGSDFVTAVGRRHDRLITG